MHLPILTMQILVSYSQFTMSICIRQSHGRDIVCQINGFKPVRPKPASPLVSMIIPASVCRLYVTHKLRHIEAWANFHPLILSDNTVAVEVRREVTMPGNL